MDKPNYTQLPNVLLENLPKFTDAELRVMLCMCRQTFGYHKETTIVMSSSFLARATGMSQQGVINATKTLMSQGYVSRIKDGLSFAYEIDLSSLPKPLNGVEGSVEATPKRRLVEPINGVEGSGLQPLNGVEGNKEREVKERKESALPLNGAPAGYKIFIDCWCRKFEEQFGFKYSFQGGRDGKAVKALLVNETVDKLLNLAAEAWRQDDPRKCWACVNQSKTISTFSSSYNAIRMELRTAAPVKRDAWGRVVRQ